MACLNIFVKKKTLTRPESIISDNTFPGPTEGNWKVSPTIIRLANTGRASIRQYMSCVSTMEASSTIKTSSSRGLAKFLSNVWVSWSKPNNLCRVKAFFPVTSERRLAALPVGALNTTFRFCILKTSHNARIMVVFPVPGPPVMTTIFSSSTLMTTFNCSVDNFTASFVNTPSRIWSLPS